MILCTCPSGKWSTGLPGPFDHPCGRAARALDEAGFAYEHRTVPGGKLRLRTLPNRAADRAEIERLSGQRDVPILVLDDGTVVAGSNRIADWAREHRHAA